MRASIALLFALSIGCDDDRSDAPAATIDWGPDVRMTSSAAASYHSYNGRMSAVDDSGRIHVVYYETADGEDEIHYLRSTDGGAKWEDDRVLATGPNTVSPVTLGTDSGGVVIAPPVGGACPAVATAGDLVHVVFRSDAHGSAEDKSSYGELHYLRSLDGGATWEDEVRLTEALEESFAPSIFTTGDQVHVAWTDYRDQITNAAEEVIEQIYTKSSSDLGATWSDDLRLTEFPDMKGGAEVVATDDRVLVFWMDHRDGDWEIYTKHSTDGVVWSDDIRLTKDEGHSEVPAVAVSGDTVHLTWTDSRGTLDSGPCAGLSGSYIELYEIYYLRSDDGGLTWGDEVRLTDSLGWSADPDIAADGSTVFITWPDGRDDSACGRDAAHEIYGMLSTDGGVTWSVDERLTVDSAESDLPSVAIGGGTAHLFWEDYRDANAEVYYKRSKP